MTLSWTSDNIALIELGWRVGLYLAAGWKVRRYTTGPTWDHHTAWVTDGVVERMIDLSLAHTSENYVVERRLLSDDWHEIHGPRMRAPISNVHGRFLQRRRRKDEVLVKWGFPRWDPQTNPPEDRWKAEFSIYRSIDEARFLCECRWHRTPEAQSNQNNPCICGEGHDCRDTGCDEKCTFCYALGALDNHKQERHKQERHKQSLTELDRDDNPCEPTCVVCGNHYLYCDGY